MFPISPAVHGLSFVGHTWPEGFVVALSRIYSCFDSVSGSSCILLTM